MPSKLLYYDVSDNSLRGKLAKLLKKRSAVRLQKSVWLLPKRSESVFRQVEREVGILWKDAKPSDSCIFTTVPLDALKGSTQWGAIFPFESLGKGDWLVL